MTWPGWAYSGPRTWDDGITWRTELVSVTAGFLALDVSFVTDKVLRARSGDSEDDLIRGYIAAATEMAEQCLDESIRPQRLRLIMSGFPWGVIELPGPPVRDVVSVESYDDDSVLQPYGGSPPSWVLTPAGRRKRARIELGAGESWPTPATRQDAAVVTYDAGYASPQEIPHLTRVGIAAVVGELYKNPDLSNGDGQAANLLNLDRFFPRRW